MSDVDAIQDEPVLSQEDIDVWERWQEVCSVHAKTSSFKRKVDSSCKLVVQALSHVPNMMVSWSGGKDSTVMAHLVRRLVGARLPVVSEKDDLDFPGEETYVRRLAAEWDMDLRVVHPPSSPWEWFVKHGSSLKVGEDIHGRSAGLSKACFYNVMVEVNRGYDGVMLGIRGKESTVRQNLRNARGRFYELKDGTFRALPIADWSGLDVLAYAHAYSVELLPVYRCVALMHENEPWNIRKSWWLPGSSAWFGQITWLRRYYPSLYARLASVMPQARMFAGQ
jgi:phosphoadenosine phosphosulfate reductase